MDQAVRRKNRREHVVGLADTGLEDARHKPFGLVFGALNEKYRGILQKERSETLQRQSTCTHLEEHAPKFEMSGRNPLSRTHPDAADHFNGVEGKAPAPFSRSDHWYDMAYSSRTAHFVEIHVETRNGPRPCLIRSRHAYLQRLLDRDERSRHGLNKGDSVIGTVQEHWVHPTGTIGILDVDGWSIIETTPSHSSD